jgi:hypothetical protein
MKQTLKDKEVGVKSWGDTANKDAVVVQAHIHGSRCQQG